MTELSAAPVGEPPTGSALGPDLGYAGLATRAISFTIDAALITVVDVVVGVAAALILSLLHIPHGLRTVLAVRKAHAATVPPVPSQELRDRILGLCLAAMGGLKKRLVTQQKVPMGAFGFGFHWCLFLRKESREKGPAPAKASAVRHARYRRLTS